MTVNINLLGIGTYFPDNVVSNEEFNYRSVDIDEQWLQSAGIKYRRCADAHTNNIDLAYKASLRAIRHANVKPDNIGMLIMVSSTPPSECIVPTGITRLKDKLKLCNSLCFSMLETCNGVLLAMEFAVKLITSKKIDNILIVAAETFSKVRSYESRQSFKVSMSMGDGAGAVLIGRTEEQKNGCLGFYNVNSNQFESGLTIHVDASSTLCEKEPAYICFGFTGAPPSINGRLLNPNNAISEIKEFTINTIPTAIKQVLQETGLQQDDIDFYLLHQPNRVFIDAWRDLAGISTDKTLDTLEQFGNLSSVSVLANLDMAYQSGKIRQGDTIMFASVGEGSWGACAWKWSIDGAPPNYLINEQTIPVAEQIITIENYSISELWRRHILPGARSSYKADELFSDFIPAMAIFENVSIDKAFTYIADITNMEKWTMSIRNLRLVSDDIYQGDEATTPTGKVFIRCIADKNAYTVGWQAGHENADDLWIYYKGILIDSELAFGRPGSAFFWSNFVHERVKSDPALSKGFEVMFSAHKIEINNLKILLESEYR